MAIIILQNYITEYNSDIINHQQAVGVNSNNVLKKAKYKFTTINSDNFDCIPYNMLVISLTKYGKTTFSNV